MKKFLTLVFTLLFVSYVSAASAGENIRIAVAGNLSYAIDSLVADFRDAAGEGNTEVDISIASSGKLSAQIVHGAPFDVFLSANMKYPEMLREKGFARTEPVCYVEGGLVLFTTGDLPLDRGLALLADDSVTKVVIPNPKLAPYGKAAMDALEASGLESVKRKFVVAENISQALQQIIMAADIGFVSKSAVFSPGIKDYNLQGRNWVEVDPSLYRPIKQGMVLLTHAGEKRSARAFYDYILSARAQKIFQKYGYLKISPDSKKE